MRSLFDLANDYERLAEHDEVIVKELTDFAAKCPPSVRDAQLLQASLLLEEARFFRERATKLRASITTGRNRITLIPDAHA
jgi:hypothetical protein